MKSNTTQPRSSCCGAETYPHSKEDGVIYQRCAECGGKDQPQPASGEKELEIEIDSAFESNYREEGDYYHIPVEYKERFEQRLKVFIAQVEAQAVERERERCLACLGKEKPLTVEAKYIESGALIAGGLTSAGYHRAMGWNDHWHESKEKIEGGAE